MFTPEEVGFSMSLDTATLFTVATCITGLLGVFILVCWVQERGTRALAWWGAAYLMGGSAVSLWSVQDSASAVPLVGPNSLVFIACGMIWNGARIFHGRAVLPGSFFAGAIAWSLAMQFEAFAASETARIVLSSLVIAGYTFLTAFELGRERRRQVGASLFGSFVPLLHGIVFLLPIPLTLLTPAGASDRWFALFALETLLYVVGTAFIIVIMAKERVLLSHKTAAMTDSLTGLLNRRAFYDLGQQLMHKQARNRGPVSVLAFDLDHFKCINDSYGHSVGDEALRLFATTARNNIRAADVLARLGGEEFVVMLAGGASDAAIVGERLRAAFQAAAAELSSHQIDATVSVGIATAETPVLIDHLLQRADIALYRAKSKGRNRVELAGIEPTLEYPVAACEHPSGRFRNAIARWNPAIIGTPTGHLPAPDTVAACGGRSLHWNASAWKRELPGSR